MKKDIFEIADEMGITFDDDVMEEEPAEEVIIYDED